MKKTKPTRAAQALAMLATELWDEKKAEQFCLKASTEEVNSAIDALRACKKDIAAAALEDVAEETARKYPG